MTNLFVLPIFITFHFTICKNLHVAYGKLIWLHFDSTFINNKVNDLNKVPTAVNISLFATLTLYSKTLVLNLTIHFIQE